jgi:hypothetical protein
MSVVSQLVGGQLVRRLPAKKFGDDDAIALDKELFYRAV